MTYIVTPLSPVYHQMTIEELLSLAEYKPGVVRMNKGSTRTYVVEELSWSRRTKLRLASLINSLRVFNEKHADLHAVEDRHTLYQFFYRPKRDGHGMRKISAPNPALSDALRELKTIFETEFNALHHTSAFGYVRGRGVVDVAKKHQQNESRWFGHFDLHDFFGSTTKEFVLQQMGKIYPFSEVMKVRSGAEELSKAIDLAFLDGGLPQGTPISPLITNLMMIPFDFIVTKRLRDFEKQSFVYTRYADDFVISSKYDFKIEKIQELILEELRKQNAPFSLNTDKTKYNSSSGRNWILGVMLNKDNQITIGYKRKKNFISMLRNFAVSMNDGKVWGVEEVQYVLGLYSYYRMIEREEIDKTVAKVNEKFSCDIIAQMKKIIA